MSKKSHLVFLLCALILGASSPVSAQKNKWPTFGNVFLFGCTVTGDMRAADTTSLSVGVIATDIDHLFKPWVLKDKTISALLLGVKLDSTLTDYRLSAVRSLSKSYPAYRISNNSDAILIAMGVNKDNISNYRYHVVINDSAEVVHWSKIPRLDKNYGASKPYGFIGKFNYPGKQVLVEVVNINNYQIRDGVVFDWRKNIRPVITNLIIHGPSRPADVTGSIEKPIFNTSIGKKAPYDTKHDPVTNEITQLSFVLYSVTAIELIMRDHPAINYQVSITNTDTCDCSFLGYPETTDGTISNFKLKSLPTQPGTYQIVVTPQIEGGADLKGQVLRIPVTILPHPILEKKASLKQLFPYLLPALIIIVLLFWFYRRRANIKLAKSVQAKQTTNLKLRSIRAQLNPHFMFNALTSIQNLVNKKDMEGANHYLSRFADLTRKVLNTSERDLISLEDEIKILDDYLQMEQLRFNFKYDINVTNNINVANIEVPAMLLQPFVENAVKHGVANLREKGVINVLVSQEQTNMVFIITDNGRGFSYNASGQAGGSFGLKLSEERIALLNEVYKDQPTKLNIQSGEGGTTITVTLTNWIS